jgi:hypothetical protein
MHRAAESIGNESRRETSSDQTLQVVVGVIRMHCDEHAPRRDVE